jgi:hypothetical protein
MVKSQGGGPVVLAHSHIRQTTSLDTFRDIPQWLAAYGLLWPEMERLNLTVHSLVKPRMPAWALLG